MFYKQDGPGQIRLVLIATFTLLPEHLDCSTLFAFCLYCYVFANIVFYNGFIAKCSTHSNKTIVKQQCYQQQIDTTKENKQC